MSENEDAATVAEDAAHYGPWWVTVTDGDSAVSREIYASTETEARVKALEAEGLHTAGAGLTVLAHRLTLNP